MKLLAAGLSCALLAGAVAAQVPYKYIAPNDRSVTYSDVPPPPNAKLLKQSAPAAASAVAPFPYELQQATSNFPVVVYTTAPCSSCDEGRNLLVNRGVPFSERTVKSNDDIEVLKRLSPDGTVPTLMVGKNKAVGFSASGWADLLDQAGYPASSKLPPNYQNAPAESAAPTPARDTVSTDSAARTPQPRSRPYGGPVPEDPPTPTAPPGFRF